MQTTTPHRPTSVWRSPMTFIRIALLAGSVWALRREFAGVNARGLLQQLAGYGWRHIAAGVAATALSFVLLGGIEILALSASGARRVSKGIAMGTAFVAHALSQSIGVALLTGAAVRARAYERRGLDAAHVTRVSALVTLGVTIGLLAAGAWAFLAATQPVVIRGHALPLNLVGMLLAASVLGFLVWSLLGRGKPSAGSRWHVPRPTPVVALGLLVLATLDWLVTGGVLYAFLPHMDVWVYLRAYIIAQTVGVLSHVPAGAGVFEVVLLGMLMTTTPAALRGAVLAAIIMYRAIYYLLPLCAAVAVAALAELRRSRRPAGDRAAASWAATDPEVAT